MTTLLSFHNDKALKAKYVCRLKAHAKADEIIHGTYWENGKGCAVGCTIHSENHTTYETELGLPEWLARLEDTLFEGLPNGHAKKFAVNFLAAIPVGKNLESVKWRFCAFILQENIERVKTLENLSDDVRTKVVNACRQCLFVHQKAIETGIFYESAAVSAAESAWSAESAAWSAESAAWSAESAAWSAESAAWSAESAARSAARSAESAARSAESAARSAARSAWSAWSAAYIRYANELIELLKKA